MARPPRLQFAGATYHLTARGNHQQEIYRDDACRRVWLGLLRDACGRNNCLVHAYCEMTNHFHLMLETREANLSQLMHQLNGGYSQWFNSRYQTVGHLFEGRFKSILIQKDSYLLELARYIVLNPVRAAIVTTADEWAWSSYHWMVGRAAPPSWLDSKSLLAMFGSDEARAKIAFADFVRAGIGGKSPLMQAKHRILGDEKFRACHESPALGAVPGKSGASRREAALPLAQYQSEFETRDEAMAQAFQSTAFTMRQIALHFGVSAQTVSRAVRYYEAGMRSEDDRI